MDKVLLKELVDIYLGVTHTPSYVDKGIPFLSVKDISSGKIIFDDCKYISEEEYHSLSKGARPQIGDMLFCRVGTIGKPIIIPPNTPTFASFVSLGYLRNKSSEKCNLEYLKFWMCSNSFKRQVASNIKGASQVNLNTGWLSNFEVPLISFKEQCRAVEILNKFENLLDLKNKQIEQLDLLIKSRFVEMFGDPYYNSNKWETKPFLELGDCKNGMNFNSQERGIEIRYVGVGDFQNRVFITNKDNLSCVSLNQMPNEEYLLKDEDILFVRSNGSKELVGRCVVVCPNNEPITYSGFCIRWRKKTDKVLITFLIHLLKHESTRAKFSGRGANIQNINQKMLQELDIILPPLALQNQFADFVQQVDKAKSSIKKSLEQLETLKKKLMQDYFG